MSDPIVLDDIHAAAYLDVRGVPVRVVEDPTRSHGGRPFTVFHVPREAAPLLTEYAVGEFAKFTHAVKRLRDRSRNVRRPAASVTLESDTFVSK